MAVAGLLALAPVALLLVSLPVRGWAVKRRPWHRWRLVWSGEHAEVESFHTFRWAAAQCASCAPGWLATRIERLS